jgi:tetratricopeptide (TPR) repeat protein
VPLGARVGAAAAPDAAATGDRRAELRARLELANVCLLSYPGAGAAEILSAAQAGIPIFELTNDDRSLTRAWRLTAYVEGAVNCRYAVSAQAAERALAHCEGSGWSTAACLGDLAAALYYGPTPAAAGIARCRALLDGADLGGEANVLVHLAPLEAMQGNLDEARRLASRSREQYEDLGQSALAYVNCGEADGQIELLAGDAPAAARAFRESCRALEAIGERTYLATRATQLAEALYLTGERDEAERWLWLAESTAGSDDVPTQLGWRAIRAKLLAATGRGEEAVALAEEALRLARQTDALNFHARAALGLAEVLALCGREEESARVAGRALELFEQKGNIVGAASVRALLAQ